MIYFTSIIKAAGLAQCALGGAGHYFFRYVMA
jgi:hypothetical protein